MTFELRPYQSELIDKTRDALRQGVRRILIQSPTGSGKTALTAYMLDGARRNGKQCWFTVHRQELITQSVAAFEKQGIPCGVIAAGWPMEDQQVQICSIDTLRSRLNKQRIQEPDFIVVDECHHATASTWAQVLAFYRKAFVIGLSATPCRLDGKGLASQFDELIKGPSVAQLMADGWLSGYRLFVPPAPSTDNLHIVAGDYNQQELSNLVDKPKLVGDAVTHYLKLSAGKRAIAFAVNIEHSLHLVANANQRGIRAMHLDGKTDKTVRQGAMNAFRAGTLQFISSCRIFEEGLDVPGIEVVIDCAPTLSLTRVMQRWGRGLRPKPNGGKLLILDHAGNTHRHGLPDDDREWTLDPPKKKRKQEPKEPSIKVCPECFAANTQMARSCAECGYVWIVKAELPKHADGELQEIDPAMIRRVAKQEQAGAQTLQQLEQIERARGYRKGWAHHVYKARMRKSA